MKTITFEQDEMPIDDLLKVLNQMKQEGFTVVCPTIHVCEGLESMTNSQAHEYAGYDITLQAK